MSVHNWPQIFLDPTAYSYGSRHWEEVRRISTDRLARVFSHHKSSFSRHVLSELVLQSISHMASFAELNLTSWLTVMVARFEFWILKKMTNLNEFIEKVQRISASQTFLH